MQFVKDCLGDFRLRMAAYQKKYNMRILIYASFADYLTMVRMGGGLLGLPNSQNLYPIIALKSPVPRTAGPSKYLKGPGLV